MAKYKIGRILVAKADLELERGMSGEKVTVPKGSRVSIGADKLAHHLRDGSIQPLPKDAIVEGYDVAGLAVYLSTALNNRYDLAFYLDDMNSSERDFVETIEELLEEIGFYG